jgi:hypothetical protein
MEALPQRIFENGMAWTEAEVEGREMPREEQETMVMGVEMKGEAGDRAMDVLVRS